MTLPDIGARAKRDVYYGIHVTMSIPFTSGTERGTSSERYDLILDEFYILSYYSMILFCDTVLCAPMDPRFALFKLDIVPPPSTNK